MGSTLDFFGKISGGDQTHNFYAVVRADSSYEDVKDIEGQTVGVMSNGDDVYTEAQDKLKKQVDVSFEEREALTI